MADKEVVGIYVTSFHNGSERLELKDNGTYVQEFASNTHPFRSTGKWRLQHEFLDGSSVVLANAVVSEDDEARPLQFGDIILYTHERAGKIVLARNEVADWYYERAE